MVWPVQCYDSAKHHPQKQPKVALMHEHLAVKTAPGKTPVIIKTTGLRKSFGEVQAVNGIDLSIHSGELFGFLGPNGAGKTTTINMLIGLARPDAGTIDISGIDCVRFPRAAQHLLGVVPDESNLYPELSGLDNLCFCAALYGLPKAERRRRADELLEMFGLTAAAKRKFGSYSKGMKRKLTIAAGIIHNPRILFLDEPTTGIDVASARQLRALIAELHREGTTIFLTTHYIEEAQRLCDRIAFIIDGRIVKVDRLDKLLQPLRDRHLLQISAQGDLVTILPKVSAAFPDFDLQINTPNELRIEANQPLPVGPLVRLLEESGVEVTEAKRIKPNLEDIFVRVTGLQAESLTKGNERAKGSS